MEVTMRAVNIALTDANKKHVDIKCKNFAKHFKQALLLNLEIKRDSHHRKGNVINICASLSLSSGESKLIHAESSEETFQKALDEALNAISRQIERLKAHPRHLKTA